MPLCGVISERSACHTTVPRVAMAPLQRCTLQQLSARNESRLAMIVLLRTLRVLFILQSASHAHLTGAPSLPPSRKCARCLLPSVSFLFKKKKAKMPQQLCATRDSNAAR
jgi:hypothetical protein